MPLPVASIYDCGVLPHAAVLIVATMANVVILLERAAKLLRILVS